ncbi:MAG: phage tail protein [Oscillospiraceae bacterium]
MANGIKRYSIRRNRLMQGLREGFNITKDGSLLTVAKGARHSIILAGLDSAKDNCAWGRLTMKSSLTDDGVLTIRIIASDQPDCMYKDSLINIDSFLLDSSIEQIAKKKFFEDCNCKCFDGSTDILLYELKGRYLWVWMELVGEATGALSDIRVYIPGDNFFRTLPQVYQNQPDDFYHRYLSIFSTIYCEQQDIIEAMPQYMDVDTAPARFLPLFAQWLGLQLDGNFLDEAMLRKFVKATPELLAVKGTRQAIEGVVRILVDVPFSLVEYNLLQEQNVAHNNIYGSDPFDFTLLISQKADERLRACLRFLIQQFSPVRSRCNIVFLNDCVGMDAFTYMDVNASLMSIQSGALDDGDSLSGITFLQ